MITLTEDKIYQPYEQDLFKGEDLYLNHRTKWHRFDVQCNKYDLQLKSNKWQQLFITGLATSTQIWTGLKSSVKS